MKTEVIRVSFLYENREFIVPAGGIRLSKGDLIIVEIPEGLDYCRVVEPANKCTPVDIGDPKIKVLRKATATDVEWIATSRETEEKAERFCEELVEELALNLKLVNVKLTFDGTKLIFFFTADKRVDFRNLVKELAKEFKTRIEMRQIGVRDKARRTGGLGICGRQLCCSTFLSDLEPITMRMAKDQNLTLSPSKISGACGRLLCCLSYEADTYRELKKDIPAVGSIVKTAGGQGEVTDVQYLLGTVTVKLSSGAVVKASPDEITVLSAPEREDETGNDREPIPE
ncbi:MAG: stage 0 sporulation protein [Candidatus Coatesbacteria bacterium]|nr:MAG: stage 0 sporulation protein [Candidatus Coatesbacteria bacterium]